MSCTLLLMGWVIWRSVINPLQVETPLWSSPFFLVLPKTFLIFLSAPKYSISCLRSSEQFFLGNPIGLTTPCFLPLSPWCFWGGWWGQSGNCRLMGPCGGKWDEQEGSLWHAFLLLFIQDWSVLLYIVWSSQYLSKCSFYVVRGGFEYILKYIALILYFQGWPNVCFGSLGKDKWRTWSVSWSQ